MHPILLHYYITNRCNSKCRFCTIWSEIPKEDANREDVQRNLNFAKKSGCRFVDFTGGEPLLHAYLPDFLVFAKKKGFITSVTTNCLLFPERVSELAGKIDLLHFSIDAGTPELHNAIRGCNSFEHVLKSIPAALKNNLVPDLLFTYTDYNIDSFEEVYQIARKNKIVVILDPVFTTNGEHDTLLGITHLKALEYAKKPGVYLNPAHLTLRKNGGNHIRNPFCRAVQSTVVITPDNKRALPCYHHRMISLPVSSLSIFTGKNHDLIVNSFKNQGKYPFCENCHINCYFDPSYNYLYNHLFFQSLASKFAYIIMKYFIYGHFRAFLRLFCTKAFII